jgi:hypothetical protein
VAQFLSKHRQQSWEAERGGQLFIDLSDQRGLVLAGATSPDPVDRSGGTWLELNPERCRQEIAQANARARRLAGYGAKLTAEDFTVIATAWPRQAPQRDVDSRLYRLDDASAGAGLATAGSEAGAGVRVSGGQGTSAANGSTLVRVGDRPMGTFPESKPYPASF